MPGIVLTIIPTIYIRPLDDQDDVEEGGAIVDGGNNRVTLFRNVCDHLKNDDFTNPKFQGYHWMVVKRYTSLYRSILLLMIGRYIMNFKIY